MSYEIPWIKGQNVKFWSTKFKPLGVQNSRVTKNKQVFKTNTLIWNLLSREWLQVIFWLKIGILGGDNWFKKVFKRYGHVLRTFHMLRTCVINFLLVKIMETNLISHENH